MAIYKRGRVYWYKFMWQDVVVRKSTKQANQNVARQIEAAHRSSLAKGEVGLRDRKPIPKLGDFIRDSVEPLLQGTTSAKTWTDYYRPNLSTMAAHAPMANLKLDAVTSERVSEFAAWRRSKGLQVSSVNSALQVLRRVLRIAAESGLIAVAPKVKMLPGERHREHVVSKEEEGKYLDSALEPLRSFATVLVDTGMRPDECSRLKWETMAWHNGKNGSLLVTHGKTAAARRVLPMSPRVREILEARWTAADRPSEGWVWPADTKTKHFERSTLKKQHQKAVKASKVRPFVLYSLRHTFLTRLGQSGCDAWTLARIAGHSSVAMSARYVHPSEDAVLDEMERLGGHNFRHTPKSAKKVTVAELKPTA